MFKKFSLIASVLVFAVAMFLTLAPQHAFAKGGGGGGNGGRAKGLITAVDTVAGTMTIADRKGGSVSVTITSATQLRKDSVKNATLAMMNVGDSADARYDAQTLIASRVDVKSAKINNKGTKIEGTITAIDLTAQSVTIQPQLGAAVTVTATASTKIERNGLHVTLADFVVGDQGEALYDAQTLLATKIEANGN